MKFGQKLSNNTQRKQSTMSFWLQVVADYTPPNNLTPDDIVAKYVNPRTHKPYTKQHIYLILRKMNVL